MIIHSPCNRSTMDAPAPQLDLLVKYLEVAFSRMTAPSLAGLARNLSTMNDQSRNDTRRHVAMADGDVLTVVYLGYRGVFTLNLEGHYALVASLILYVAECYGAVLMFLFFFQIWDVRNPRPWFRRRPAERWTC